MKIKMIGFSLNRLTTCEYSTFPFLTDGGTWSCFYLNAVCVIRVCSQGWSWEESLHFFLGKDQKICSRWLKFSVAGELRHPMRSSMSGIRKKCQEILLVTSTPIIITPIVSPKSIPRAIESMIFRCSQKHWGAKRCHQAPWDFQKSHTAIMIVERQGGCQGINVFSYFCHHVCKHHISLESFILFPSSPSHSNALPDCTVSLWTAHSLRHNFHLI